mmetsp:Transcript_25674/g.38864  ORF Transcript_25674/g.38864 Transcript_25674/m.38864 type:complete len:251 (-) Transcript_25674:14-766(-)
MGSSFAAGMGILPREAISGGPSVACFRSRHNYARLVAEARNLSLVDVGCAGASTRHVLTDPQYDAIPPQIEAVDERTRLVTITIGGNDVNYIGRVIGCSEKANWELRQLFSCDPPPQEEEKFEILEKNMLRISQEVKHRAPNAQLIYVSYPAVLPANNGTTCEDLGLSEEKLEELRTVASRLLRITYRVAEQTDSIFIDADALSPTEGLCAAADESWIFPATHQDLGAFHPNAKAMREQAIQISSVLDAI